MRRRLKELWRNESGDMFSLVGLGLAMCVVMVVVGYFINLHDGRVGDGTYDLNGGSGKPVPSVVFDASTQDYQIQVNRINNTYYLPQSQITFKVTKGQRELVAQSHHYTIFLHATDEISKVESDNSGSTFIFIPFVK